MGTTWLPRFTGHDRGVIPDGKQVYIADPGFFAFDRVTLVPTFRAFVSDDILSMSFQADGRRAALITGARKTITRDLGIVDSGKKSLLRVLDTTTGRTTHGMVTKTRFAQVYLSPQGDKVVLVHEDNTLELIPLP